MPSLLSTTVAANYNQVGNVNGLGGTVRIINAAKTNMTTAQVNTLIKAMMYGPTKGTDDAVSIAGLGTADGSAFVSGTTDTVYLAIQGTGDVTVATADMGISGLTITVEAVFVANN